MRKRITTECDLKGGSSDPPFAFARELEFPAED